MSNFIKETSTNHIDKAGGREVHQMSTYYINLCSKTDYKGWRGRNVLKSVHMVYGRPLGMRNVNRECTKIVYYVKLCFEGWEVQNATFLQISVKWMVKNVFYIIHIKMDIWPSIFTKNPLKNKEKVRQKSWKSDILRMKPKIVRFMMPE